MRNEHLDREFIDRNIEQDDLLIAHCSMILLVVIGQSSGEKMSFPCESRCEPDFLSSLKISESLSVRSSPFLQSTDILSKCQHRSNNSRSPSSLDSGNGTRYDDHSRSQSSGRSDC